MILYPAVDLMGGKAVRLRKGKREDVTVYGEGTEMARSFRKAGAQWLHLVDLDAAFDGTGRSLELIRAIVTAFGGHVELGGGLRSFEYVEMTMEAGVECCILGSAAVLDPELVRRSCQAYPGRIVAGIDADHGLACVHGWVRNTGVSAVKLALDMRDMGVTRIIYTDVNRDGMMQGPNLQETEKMVRETGMDIVMSGGVSSLDDIRHARDCGCSGVVLGRALYEKAFTLSEAVEGVKEWN